MEQIRLDIIPKGITPVCHASQYDSGRIIRLNLVDGLQGYVLTDETVELDVRKPDGHIVTAAVTATSGTTYVDIVTTEQMTACAGENICELKISKTGVEIYSLNFRMQVEKSVLEGGDPSESFIHNLNEQIYEAVAEQYTGDVIFDSEPTADHGTGYAVTSEGVKNALENISIRNLTDVNINNPQTNEALGFDSEGNVVNKTVSTVGSIDDLSDVDTTGKGNDYSLVYNSNDAEWQAKKLTVEVTQAEYDQLKLDGDLVEGVHYVITDGQDVTCNLGDLNDVDTSGASTGDILGFNGNDWVKKGGKIITEAIVTATTLTTTSTDYNTYSSRKFSDYDLLVFKIGYGSDDCRKSVVIPQNNWYSGASIIDQIIHGSSVSTITAYEVSNFSITYKSDTSITAVVGGSGAMNKLRVYGLKFAIQ